MAQVAAVQPETDVVVVGAGHNGLTAACYLAKAGLSVTVLEAAPRIGGMTSSAPLVPGAPDHLINPCAVDVIFMRASSVPADLSLDGHGLRMVEPDPSYVYLHPDGASLAFWRDPNRTVEEIRRFAPADANTYRELIGTLYAFLDMALPFMLANPLWPGFDAFGRAMGAAREHRRRLGAVASLAASSAVGVVEERFRHPIVRSALAILVAGAGPQTQRGSGITLAFPGMIHRLGVGRIVGGTQRLVEALRRRLEADSGRVRTSAIVERILVRDGRASGVRLEGGEEIRARRVLASCDPRTTLERLLPETALSERLRARVKCIPTNASGTAAMTLHVALSGRIRLSRHGAARKDAIDLRLPIAIVGTIEEIERAFVETAAGEIPREPSFYGAVPTGMDPSQAPAGQDTLYLYVPLMPLRPREGWENAGEAAETAVVKKASAFYDGIEALEIGRFRETPPDLARRVRATEGCISHVDVPFRAGPLRPALGFGGYRTPVPGLYLTGAGTHPGPGISGIQGKLAAEALLRDARRR